jgi:hypothetical protein
MPPGRNMRQNSLNYSVDTRLQCLSITMQERATDLIEKELPVALSTSVL